MLFPEDWWWDITLNLVGGCTRVSEGCRFCYAAQIAGTKTGPNGGPLGIHDGVTRKIGKRRRFNGKLTVAADGDDLWTKLLEYRGAKNPKLGPGKPSLIFVGDMSDLFHEKRPDEIIERVVETVALSAHIGLLLTKRAQRMRAFFEAQPPSAVRCWQANIWLGFSAENQEWFDKRWADMRALASRARNIHRGHDAPRDEISIRSSVPRWRQFRAQGNEEQPHSHAGMLRMKEPMIEQRVVLGRHEIQKNGKANNDSKSGLLPPLRWQQRYQR